MSDMTRDSATAKRAMTAELAGRIQSTLIQIGLTEADIVIHCDVCARFGFQAAMVPARFVSCAARTLIGTSVVVASAVDFPLGLMSTKGRVTEAANLVDLGAQEIDIGVPIGLLKANQDTELYADLVAIVDAVKPIPVKAMLELPLLTAAERDRIVDLAVQAGVSYLKNASAGSVGVATPEDIAYLRARAPAHVKVKASGGIKTYEQVQALIAAGADVVGTSAAVAIIQGRHSVVKHEY